MLKIQLNQITSLVSSGKKMHKHGAYIADADKQGMLPHIGSLICKESGDDNVPADVNEILCKVYKDFINGVSKITLFGHLTVVDSIKEYYLTLHRMRRAGYITIDSDGCLYLSEGIRKYCRSLNPDSVSIKRLIQPNAADQLSPKVKTMVTKRTVITPVVADLITVDFSGQVIPVSGRMDLPRDKHRGKILYCLWRYRNTALTNREISLITGISKLSVYPVVRECFDKGIIIHGDSDVPGDAYKWSGFHSYPFKEAFKSDETMCKYLPDEWTKVKRQFLVGPGGSRVNRKSKKTDEDGIDRKNLSTDATKGLKLFDRFLSETLRNGNHTESKSILDNAKGRLLYAIDEVNSRIKAQESASHLEEILMPSTA